MRALTLVVVVLASLAVATSCSLGLSGLSLGGSYGYPTAGLQTVCPPGCVPAGGVEVGYSSYPAGCSAGFSPVLPAPAYSPALPPAYAPAVSPALPPALPIGAECGFGKGLDCEEVVLKDLLKRKLLMKKLKVCACKCLPLLRAVSAGVPVTSLVL